MCGKNPSKVFHAFVESGSPPRVREKPNLVKVTKSNARITPACAGKTRTIQPFAELVRDHPRVCGKNVDLTIGSQSQSGSPPRVREKLRVSVSSRKYFGITPACAGKTISSKLAKSWSWDHPRVCGKNENGRRITSFGSGSPPRVREKQLLFLSVRQHHRITPACAGKTCS